MKQKTAWWIEAPPANTLFNNHPPTNPDMTQSYQKQLEKLVKGYALLPHAESKQLESARGAVASVTIRFERTQAPLHGVQLATSAGFSDQRQSKLVTWSNRDGSTRFPRQIGAALRSLGRHAEGKQRILAFFRALIRLKGVCMLDVTPPPQDTQPATTTTTTTVTTPPSRRFVKSAAAFRLQHAWQRFRERQPPQEAADSWEDL